MIYIDHKFLGDLALTRRHSQLEECLSWGQLPHKPSRPYPSFSCLSLFPWHGDIGGVGNVHHALVAEINLMYPSATVPQG